MTHSCIWKSSLASQHPLHLKFIYMIFCFFLPKKQWICTITHTQRQTKQNTLSCKDPISTSLRIRKCLQIQLKSKNEKKKNHSSFDSPVWIFFPFLLQSTIPWTILYLYWAKHIYRFHLVDCVILNVFITIVYFNVGIFVSLEESANNGQI